MDSKTNEPKTTTEFNPFRLPKQIIQRLRSCSEEHEGRDRPLAESAKYLWLYVTPRGEEACGDKMEELSLEEWLNVIDEAASIGVDHLIVCVGDSLSKYPDIWALCEWAQCSHDMVVGLHLEGDARLTDEDVERLKTLDLEKTLLLAERNNRKSIEEVEELGIQVVDADVTAEDHTPPCDMPENMVCVSAGGNMYTCGLVLGDDRFCLGNVSEKPLSQIMEDGTLPHTIPTCVHKDGHECDGCPPMIQKRVAGSE